jgi:hypothetical protein
MSDVLHMATSSMADAYTIVYVHAMSMFLRGLPPTVDKKTGRNLFYIY